MSRKQFIFYYIWINSILWIIVHIILSFVITRMQFLLFSPNFWLFRTRAWERRGTIYNKVYIKKWKRLLPDGALLFAGAFSEKHLSRTDPDYLNRFIHETCRGEAVHWLSLMIAPLFMFWNTPAGTIINIVYAAIANIPCIITQRFIRPHLQSLLHSVQRPSSEHHHRFCI